jgi:2',3'-cyclic-nucleotide 2'-phosphodiesterase (5'-nucleotidase family)
MSSVKIPIDSTTEQLADRSYTAYLQPFKEEVDAKMNKVIGTSVETMRGHAPESLLSNFSADVYLLSAAKAIGQPIDIAVVNMGSLRTQIPAGNILVRHVFELMPFENELVVLWIKGDKLYQLFQFFAKVGGEGIAGMSMEIVNGKAENILIGGKSLDMNKLYKVSTNDFLAGGNDKMYQLAEYEKRINTGIKIRTILLDYFTGQTAQGKSIQSKLDGRIKIIQ